MKRAAIGVLLVSLFAGTAMAGTVYRAPANHEPPRADHHDRQADSRRADHRNNDRRDNDHRDWGRDDRGRGRHVHYAPPPRVVYRPAPIRYGMYRTPHGYYAHSWRRGERLPFAYYQRPYLIADYRGCGLRRPPVGYHWVRVNHDAVLAVIATGVVLDIAYNLFG
jgi:Ni/Co efflux regulator RcnB